MKLYIAMERELLVADQQNGKWQVASYLVGMQITSLATDPFHPERVYCGTYRRGLWRSEDAGHSWEPIGDAPFAREGGITYGDIMAIAVSPTERAGAYGVVYVGTEPSALFRSEDGGATWRELTTFRELPSASTWSFPPKPSTSHVRCITPDLLVASRLFVAVEAGALVRSLDGGEHWVDREPGGPIDTHSLVMHRLAPDRLYSAAGDGLFTPGRGYQESHDAGKTWQCPDEGLSDHYLRSVAVDPADPDTIVVSAAATPLKLPDGTYAEPALYRKTLGEPWRKVLQVRGTMMLHLASNPAEPGVFYALGLGGVYRSPDAGLTWEQLALPWSEDLAPQFPQTLVLSEA